MIKLTMDLALWYLLKLFISSLVYFVSGNGKISKLEKDDDKINTMENIESYSADTFTTPNSLKK